MVAQDRTASVSSGQRSAATSALGAASNAQSQKRQVREGETLGSSAFEIQAAKAKVLKAIEDSATGLFKRFYQTPLCDQLLKTCLLYFIARFHHETLQQALDKARRQHQEGVKPEIIQSRLDDLQATAARHLADLSPIYSSILLKYSQFSQTYQDRLFWENLYEALVAVLCEAFTQATWREAVEVHVGYLFRTSAFNLHARKHAPPRSIDTLQLRELAALKTDTANRALNAKLLASLYDKVNSIHVQSTALTNTPLIAEALSSPLVNRNAKFAALSTKAGGQKGPGTAAIHPPAANVGSSLPVTVDSQGMVTDDNIRELEQLLKSLVQGARGGHGSLRETNSNRSLVSTSASILVTH
ncbi:hypothetical protein WJX72_001558 [[Myrmecia] bisecta]|uniref:Uncharacterized protein n=1 Tax=[Myrmecia] bisecta TaxID=41462 RepID=A0AAW1PAL5_9CHLO